MLNKRHFKCERFHFELILGTFSCCAREKRTESESGLEDLCEYLVDVKLIKYAPEHVDDSRSLQVHVHVKITYSACTDDVMSRH